jgi:hypothetical protein
MYQMKGSNNILKFVVICLNKNYENNWLIDKFNDTSSIFDGLYYKR